ncbi:DUF3375 domain-containing protein [Achromobacter insuavis]|uniref:DUF3375 domain-containing protein n=1 Tax=Achromobacter insuavis AXX-A TaxID=1003200 RepID=F7SXR3_9BURK|nr:DUF3375 domain-containing protein [Achromobacter insuavis]EGP47083.1 hypothetical protein AXXA_07305 [Achromobacter insuavis AXX-A]
MSTQDTFALYEDLRARKEEPAWRLLATPQSPAICTCLHVLFLSERILPSSAFHERLHRQLEIVRRAGADLPKPAADYASDWIAEGWLRRDFPHGATEEMFELTAPAVDAIRYLMRLSRPRATATESRLASVVQLLQTLAEETDSNPATRLAGLLADRDALNAQIQAVRSGKVTQLPPERAIERAREVLTQSSELLEDFVRVQESLAAINLQLRRELVENDGARANTLERIFDGIDVIKQTEAGRAFDAFWRMLVDPVASTRFEAALTQVITRPFLGSLDAAERRSLTKLKSRMVERAADVHTVQATFASGLQSFVRSREFREQRRLVALLRSATVAAMAAAADTRPTQKVDAFLFRTSAAIRSASQWMLHDPTAHVVDATMTEIESSDARLEDIEELVQRSEIDMRSLKRNLVVVLGLADGPVSIAHVLERFPAEQGLGSVVGYMHLATRHAEPTERRERVRWEGGDGIWRSADAPLFYFSRECIDELRE